MGRVTVSAPRDAGSLMRALKFKAARRKSPNCMVFPTALIPAVARAQVLTTGSWPTQMAARCSLPRELEACCEEFRAFYLASHSGRKLSWQTNMGNAGAPPSLKPCLSQHVAGIVASSWWSLLWTAVAGVSPRFIRGKYGLAWLELSGRQCRP